LYRALQEEATERIVDFSLLEMADVPWVDVRTYGAKGDGETDDTKAIQAALTSMTPGGVLLIPEGDYLVGATWPTPCLTVANDDILIMGVGHSSRIYTADTTTIFNVTGDRVFFMDLMIEGDGTTTDDGSKGPALIRFYRVAGGGVHNCKLYKPHTYGVLVKESYNVDVVGNHIEGNYTTWPGTGHTTHAGICGSAAANSRIAGNRITNCVQGALLSISGAALNVDGENSDHCRGLIFEGNKFYNNMNHHIYSTDGYNCSFLGNMCHTTYDGAGIKVMYHNAIISGNHSVYAGDVTTFGGYGIYLDLADDCIVTNNYAAYNPTDGIEIKRSSNCTVSSNVAELNGYHGIRLLEDSTDNTVQANVCRNNATVSAGDGIRIQDTGTACLYNVLGGNTCIDTRTPATQVYGIGEQNLGDYNLIHGNITRGNLTAGINHTGVNTVEADNLEI